MSLVKGDTHGQNVERIKNIHSTIAGQYKPEEVGIIILGDSGFNYYLDSSDTKGKKKVSALGYHIYCVRGNHEQRPELVGGMKTTYSENVHGFVYYQPDFPLIKYFKDGGIYHLLNYKVLTIGGAYSVDKYYRIDHGWQWFPQEELSDEEMIKINDKIYNKSVDFIFTHTCPLMFQPTDLFLPTINQASVSNRMETFLNSVIRNVDWKFLCFGHYHADRLENEKVMQFYKSFMDLDTLYNTYVKKEIV